MGALTVRPESFRAPLGLTVGPNGAVYVADAQGTTVVRIDPQTKARVVAARGLRNPLYVAFDKAGRLLVADESNRILRYEADGSRVVVAGNGRRDHTGDGGPASAASLGGASGMDVDGAGNLILAEYDGWIRIVRPNGTIGSLAGNGSEGYAGDGGPASDGILRHPHDVALMPDDSIIVADSHNSAIRRISADGIISTVARGLGAPVGAAPAPDGAVFVAEGEGRITLVRPNGSRTTVATGTTPFGIASDSDGNVYFSELGTRRVKRVDASTGTVTTLFP